MPLAVAKSTIHPGGHEILKYLSDTKDHKYIYFLVVKPLSFDVLLIGTLFGCRRIAR